MVKVSVIVPVYNPGDNIEDCIRSLLEQSLPPESYEAIFVDDGSTDETPARLDALAAEHPNVRVEHIENSGWPGRPRNIGIELARGEYVYFVDNDDYLAPEALERLVDRADRDEADIVIGKVVGHGKFVPRGMFRRNRSHLDVNTPTLLGLLSPHKLFRKALLDEHRIRFPEGRRRLEDHVFVVHAYFHADRGISILADYPCYHWVLRDRETNASFKPFDPVAYFENVREVLDLVVEHTEPGELRDRMLAHWYRGKMLKRVGGQAFVDREPEYNHRLHEEIRRLAQERYGPEVDRELAFNLAVRSKVLRDGGYDDLMTLARFEGGLRAKATVRDVKGRARGLAMTIQARMRGREAPLEFERRGDRVLWKPPEELRHVLGDDDLDVTDALSESRIQVLLRSTQDGSEYSVPVEMRPVDLDHPDTLVAEATADPRKAAGGAPLPDGDWEVHTVVTLAGFTANAKARRRGFEDPVRVGRIQGGQLVERGGGRRIAPPPPPSLKGRIAKRMPWLVRLVRRNGAAAGAGRAARR